MATNTECSPAPPASTGTEQKEDLTRILPVITAEERDHLSELGLGRGIDSTDPNMWKNKTPMQIRFITEDLKNVIGTNESGIKQVYEKTVSSLRSQQSKIKLAVRVPGSHVKIGLDAHYSQSINTSVRIMGTKVQSRTISFRHDFNDIPNDLVNGLNGSQQTGFQAFENDMAKWLLAYLRNQNMKEILAIDDSQDESDLEKLDKLARSIKSVDSPCAKAISEACRLFVFSLGITHYVSSIELGALSYSVETLRSMRSNKGVGGSLEAASTATTNASVDFSSAQQQQTKEGQAIGYFDDKGVIRRNTSDEAVIGFEIKPISWLMRVAAIQLAMKTAIEIYIQSKTDSTTGPFLMSTTISNNPIYWKVDQETIHGTQQVENASLFYFIPLEEGNFLIAHWGDEPEARKLLTNINHRLSKLRSAAPVLPQFVSVSTNTLGYAKGPLTLKTSYTIKSAQFAVYSRMHTSLACLVYTSSKEDLQTWMEGDQFYIKHEPSIFNSVYVAIQSVGQQPTYTSTTLSRRREPGDSNFGMLFRLHPQELRKTGINHRSPADHRTLHLYMSETQEKTEPYLTGLKAASVIKDIPAE